MAQVNITLKIIDYDVGQSGNTKTQFFKFNYLFLIEFEVKNKHFNIELLFEFEKGSNHIHPLSQLLIIDFLFNDKFELLLQKNPYIKFNAK